MSPDELHAWLLADYADIFISLRIERFEQSEEIGLLKAVVIF